VEMSCQLHVCVSLAPGKKTPFPHWLEGSMCALENLKISFQCRESNYVCNSRNVVTIVTDIRELQCLAKGSREVCLMSHCERGIYLSVI
jgi:hypothetical protein